jgi:hypothetical protein
MRTLVLVGAAMSVCSLSGCGWSDALNSDPAAWAPSATSDTAPLEPGTAGAAPVADECEAESPPSLHGAASTSTTVSHRAGEPWLQGCHEPGGSARSSFAAAGTAHERQGVRSPARGGRVVQGIGGTALVVDACGNFYARAEALAASPARTQPWLKDPTFRRMEKPLTRQPRAGDCNQSGCHDFSSRVSVGIYF